METEGSKAGVIPRGTVEPLGKEDILRRSLLASVAGESRRALLDLGMVERLPRRFTIAAQGEPARTFMLIGAGRVKLERTRGDRPLMLGHRGPGQMAGETAVGGSALATETITVLDEVEAMTFAIDSFRARLADDAPLHAAIAAALVGQQRELEERLLTLLLHSVEDRLAAFLLDAAARWGANHEGGRLLTAPFTHAEIALLIGSTRETVTLVLGRMKRDGLIAFERRRIILRNSAELERRLARPEG
jgi:CRP-like cAMP-binding protein